MQQHTTAENPRLSEMELQKDENRKNDETLNLEQRGQVYFVRHGESTSNERNIFAGVLDVALTPYGRMQARRAGKNIKEKGVRFDAVYVSHLRRARQTCEIALQESQSLRDLAAKPIIDHRISERSFGILTGENKNLCRHVLGHTGFEGLIHSHNEAAPGGESIENVYLRVVDFYEQEVVPRLARGENVLVVCHEYVLEPLSLYLCGLPANAYKRLKIPNAKALSCNDLIRFREDEVSPSAVLRKSINDLSALYAAMLYALIFIVAACARCILDTQPMPTGLFRFLTVCGLAFSTFYTYLSLDFQETAKNVSAMTTRLILGWWAARWLLGLVLIGTGILSVTSEGQPNPLMLWLLILLVPPGLTTPTLSLVWGGNLYPSAALSKNLSIIIPLALIAFVLYFFPANQVTNLGYFYLVVLVGLGMPAIAAQLWRQQSPVKSNHHNSEFKFIGVLSFGLISGSLGYQLTPPTLLSDLFGPGNGQAAIHSDQQLAMALLVFFGMRLAAWVTQQAVRRRPDIDPAESQDIWILLTQPNFLLWLSIVLAISPSAPGSESEYVAFWAAAVYICLPVIDQMTLKQRFSSHLLKESLRSSRLSDEKVDEIIREVDVDGSGELQLSEIKILLQLIEGQTTGLKANEETLGYVSQCLLEAIDADEDGKVSCNELKRYISMYGLVANLNLSRKALI